MKTSKIGVLYTVLFMFVTILLVWIGTALSYEPTDTYTLQTDTGTIYTTNFTPSPFGYGSGYEVGNEFFYTDGQNMIKFLFYIEISDPNFINVDGAGIWKMTDGEIEFFQKTGLKMKAVK